MRNIITSIIIIILVITNLFSIWFIVKKGVTVNNTYNIENHQHQNQQQSMVVMSDVKAKNITWKLVRMEEMSKLTGIYSSKLLPEMVTAYLNTITPWQADMTKILPETDMYYPSIVVPVEEASK